MQEPRVADTAVKWGVNPQDILHAYRNAISFTVGGDGMDIAVGPARSGALLEVGFIYAIDGVVILHCMPARSKFLPGR